jgi:hypothetical protein
VVRPLGEEREVTAPAAAPPRGRVLALALATFVAGAARYATEIDDAWDDSLASINGANYTGNIERAFRRAGYEELRGLPYLFVAPTTTRTDFDQIYLHHPPLFRGLVHGATLLFGFTERGVRLLPILCTALAGAVLVLLIAPQSGLGPAAGAAGFFLAVPMSWHYGWMANYEAPLLLSTVLAVGLHARLRTRSVAAYWPVYLVFLAATQVDWAGYFIGPALWMYELCRPKADRRWPRTFVLVPLGAVAAAFVVAHVAWARGESFAQAFGHFGRTAVNATHGDPLLPLHPARFDARAWFETAAAQWIAWWTWAGVAAAILGLLWFVWRRAVREDETTALAFAFLAPPVLNAALFRQAAFVHDFWWFGALPFVVLAVAELLRAGRRVPYLALVAAIALVGVCAWRTVEIRARQDRTVGGTRRLAEEINRLAKPDDVLLTQADLGQASFYVDAWVVKPLEGDYAPEKLLPFVRDLIRSGGLRVKRAVALLPDRLTKAGMAEEGQNWLIDQVAPLGRLERKSPADFARDFPVMSAMLGGSGLAVLVIE